MERTIVTRAEARAKGLGRYYTGNPCLRGHVAERRTDNSDCLDCRPINFAKWYDENRDDYLEKKKATYPERAETQRRYSLEYHFKNKKAKTQYAKKWRAENRERRNAIEAEWKRKNPKKVAATNRKRRAMKAGCEGHHTAKDVDVILKRQRGKCAECFSDLGSRYHVDHIMPISKGGSDWPSNLQCLCPPCNIKKSNKHPIDWAQENGRLL